MGRREALLRAKAVQLSVKFSNCTDEEQVFILGNLARLYLELEDATAALETLSKVDEQRLYPSALQCKARAYYMSKQLDAARSICDALLRNSRLMFTKQIEYSTFGISSRLLNNADEAGEALVVIEQGLAHGVQTRSTCRNVCGGTRGALLIAGASLCRQTRLLDKALTFLEEAHGLREDCLAPYRFAHVWLEVAQVYEDFGQSLLAEAAVGFASGLRTGDIGTEYRVLAQVHFEQGDDRAGDACIRQAAIRCACLEEEGEGQARDACRFKGTETRYGLLALKLRFRRACFEALIQKRTNAKAIKGKKKQKAKRIRPIRSRNIRKQAGKQKGSRHNESSRSCKATQTSVELACPPTQPSETGKVEHGEEENSTCVNEDNGEDQDVALGEYSMDDFDIGNNETIGNAMESLEEKRSQVTDLGVPAPTNHAHIAELHELEEEHKREGSSILSGSEAESHLYNSEDERALLSPPVEMELEKMFSENPDLLDTAHLFESNSIISDISFDMNKDDMDIGKGDPIFEDFLFEDDEEIFKTAVEWDESTKEPSEPATQSIDGKQDDVDVQAAGKGRI